MHCPYCHNKLAHPWTVYPNWYGNNLYWCMSTVHEGAHERCLNVAGWSWSQVIWAKIWKPVEDFLVWVQT